VRGDHTIKHATNLHTSCGGQTPSSLSTSKTAGEQSAGLVHALGQRHGTKPLPARTESSRWITSRPSGAEACPVSAEQSLCKQHTATRNSMPCKELDLALETLEMLRERHTGQLTAAAYGVVINGCAKRGRGTEGVDLFDLFRLDASCSSEAAMQAMPFLYR